MLASGKNTHTATLSFNSQDSIRRFESLMKLSGAAAAVSTEQVSREAFVVRRHRLAVVGREDSSSPSARATQNDEK